MLTPIDEMAGKEDDKKENPFSFKNFMEKCVEKDGESNRDAIGTSNDTTDESQAGSSANAAEVKREENPFSFKQFLRHSDTLQQKSAPEVSKNNKTGFGGARPKQKIRQDCNSREQYVSAPRQSYVTPDIATDLPDFVQDHFHSENARTETAHELPLPDLESSLPNLTHGCNQEQNKTETVPNLPDFTNVRTLPSVENDAVEGGIHELDLGLPDFHLAEKPPGLDLNLPDFALQLNPPEVVSNTVKQNCDYIADNGDGVLEKNTLSSVKDECSSGLRTTSDSSALPSKSLPDFLSDGPMLSSNAGVSSDLSSPENLPGAELEQLRNANEHLRNELRRVEQNKKIQVLELKAQLEALKEKEAEETSALEAMVQKVEANLQLTTERAVKAEETVKRLKEEVKSLHMQVSHLMEENEMLKSGETDAGLSNTRQTTRLASKQLAAAANSAESQLKQLMAGVDSLRLLSNMLANADKISEPPQKDTASNF